MSETWSRVDTYVADRLLGEDKALEQALADAREAGLPPINVSAAQGKFLHLIVRSLQARSVLEIGTLAGYSTIWMARALPPDGRLTTLEIEQRHATVARRNLERAGVADRVEIVVAPASQTLGRLASERPGSFDLIFIDADKPGYSDYLRWSVELVRDGGCIIADNVVRDGEILDQNTEDENARAIRAFIEILAADRRLSATIVQTVGAKGYDGFALAVKERSA